jgi:signal transduction histidine kinase
VVISHREVLVTIRDTGIGMPPEQVENLFKLDYKYSSLGTNNEKGSGLGMIICKEFIEKLGGSMTVESKKDHGTTISFNLPVGT